MAANFALVLIASAAFSGGQSDRPTPVPVTFGSPLIATVPKVETTAPETKALPAPETRVAVPDKIALLERRIAALEVQVDTLVLEQAARTRIDPAATSVPELTFDGKLYHLKTKAGADFVSSDKTSLVDYVIAADKAAGP